MNRTVKLRAIQQEAFEQMISRLELINKHHLKGDLKNDKEL